MRVRPLAPLAAALLGLAGSLAATLALHRAASSALDGVLTERLRGAGETAARLLEAAPATPAQLRAIMEANALDGAYLVSPSLVVLADANGAAGAAADLLRVDAARVEAALRGQASVGRAYDLGAVSIETGYFPVRGPGGAPAAVLALEAGKAFSGAREGLRRALAVGVVLSAAGALALAVAAARWSRAERARREEAARAARGEALARMAAAVAHEVRNPLGIIRGAVELVRARSQDALPERDRERLSDVLGEVERLRRLTQDFLDLSAEPALEPGPVDLAEVARDAARGSAAVHPELEVRIALEGAPHVRGDPGRLRQVLANLLANAAQAGARTVRIDGAAEGGLVKVRVQDDGPGIPPEVRARLFDPFTTGREGGTGLGLAVSRRIVERHGGTLALAGANGAGGGTTFELRLPGAAS
jgi:two-component system, OmpR family, sensor kinase